MSHHHFASSMRAVVFDSGLFFAVHFIVGLLVESCVRGLENAKKKKTIKKRKLRFRIIHSHWGGSLIMPP